MGRQVGAVLTVLGFPPLPWVVDALEVLFEYRPTRSGPEFRFREAVLSTPRQCMKSSLGLGLLVHRAAVLEAARPQATVYSAQSGLEARRKFRDDWLPVLKRSPIAGAIENIRLGGGTESILFKGGGRLEPIATTESAAHGRTIDLAVLDEAFSDTDDSREQAVVPATLTRGAHTGGTPMVITVSTAGTDASTYLRRKIDAGRASVEVGVDNGLYFCEYGMPDDADLDDEELWWRHHPGLGHLISLTAIRHLRSTMPDSDWRRAIANQWVHTARTVIPFDAWLACRDTAASPGARLMFGVDVNPERTHTAIAAADPDGALELVEYRPGLSWVPERIVELLHTYRTARVIVDGAGPASTLLAELERSVGARRLRVLTAREGAQASATLLDGVVERWLMVRPHPALDAAVAGARKRQRGDAFTWARQSPTTDLCPLVAASLAVWAARSIRGPQPAIYPGLRPA